MAFLSFIGRVLFVSVFILSSWQEWWTGSQSLETKAEPLLEHVLTQTTIKLPEVERRTLLESNIIVYKFIQDLHFFVIGRDDENELILDAVLQGFCEAVSLLLRSKVDKYEALENLDVVLLCLDKIVDGGMALETDANVTVGKVATNTIDSGVPLSQQLLR
ncbi:Coatomer subunit zeta-3-like protein [Drosera capensis]